ncbi:hypothetical protein C8R47DRAFT_751684 [Mycena vitilis]|nr:hypothetical protein C8R47DRAFT_751684 [Mycena vitilis]
MLIWLYSFFTMVLLLVVRNLPSLNVVFALYIHWVPVSMILGSNGFPNSSTRKARASHHISSIMRQASASYHNSSDLRRAIALLTLALAAASLFHTLWSSLENLLDSAPSRMSSQPLSTPDCIRSITGGGVRQRFHGKRLELHVVDSNSLSDWKSRDYTFEFQCQAADAPGILKLNWSRINSNGEAA